MTASDSVTIVRAYGRRRLAKTIRADGTIDPYDQAKTFDLIPQPVADLEAIEVLLRQLAARSDCAVVRGAPADPTHTEAVRRLLYPDPETGEAATLVEVPRRWVALDIDHLARPEWIEPEDLIACAAVAIRKLPSEFQQARFIVQATGGHGLKPGVRVRLWAWLSRPVSGAELKFWFRNSPVVDQGIFITNQVIYTATPVFLPGAVDPLPQRMHVIPGQEEVPVPSPDQVKPPPNQVKPSLHQRRRPRTNVGNGNISGLIRTVAAARHGNRNAALYWAGCRVAEHEGGDRGADARDLIAAALVAGLSTKEATATVESALRGGRP